MRAARPEDRAAMLPRAKEILDNVAIQIESEADAELEQLLGAIRTELETGS